MRTRVKICGLRSAEHARVAADAGADAIGLVFVAASPRHVDMDLAWAVRRVLPAFVDAVGLFVDAPIDTVREISRALGLATVQLHGQETPEYAAALAPLRVVKALPFRDAQSLARAAELWRGVDNLAALLLDTPAPSAGGPASATLPGGGGQRFDWAPLRQALDAGAALDLPLILAGGLTPANVAHAIALLRPYAVDVSSGVESSRGQKSPDLIRQFLAATR